MVLCITAMTFYKDACAYAHTRDSIGFTWTAEASMQGNYLWRGMYTGGLSFQADASLGYGGLSAGMWWNLGATDWSFRTPGPIAGCTFNPEVDVYLKFSRWGVTLTLIEMYYFDRYKDGRMSKFFDYANHGPKEGGVTTEIRLGYRVSDRIPLSILWCTRFSGRDGYFADGVLKRAYSSYIELGYDFHLPQDVILATRLGMTPWKSMYTSFRGQFAVVCIDVKAMRTWELNPHVDLTVLGEVMLNPWGINRENVWCSLSNSAEQRLNLNAAVAIGFK